MTEALWKIPVPPTALFGETFKPTTRRQCELSFLIEAEDGGEKRAGLIFEGVEAYKCTYMTSRTTEMIRAAYGQLVRLGKSPWLDEVSEASAKFYKVSKEQPKELQHLMICFDDGPCYEVICVLFRPF